MGIQGELWRVIYKLPKHFSAETDSTGICYAQTKATSYQTGRQKWREKKSGIFIVVAAGVSIDQKQTNLPMLALKANMDRYSM